MDRVRITVTFDIETYKLLKIYQTKIIYQYRKLCAGTQKPGLMEVYQNQI